MALKDDSTNPNRLDTQPPPAGTPPLDPTINVQNLLLAATKRADDLNASQEKALGLLRKADRDLAEAEGRRIDDLRAAETRRTDDLRSLAAVHLREVQEKEEGRLNSIRQVDVSNQAAQAKSALDAIQALAQTTNVNADNIRNQLNATTQQNAKQVADLAASLATSTAASNDAIYSRLAALERAASEGIGKERVADPALALALSGLADGQRATAVALAKLGEVQQTNNGKGLGAGQAVGYVLSAVFALGAIIGIIAYFAKP